MAYLLDLVGPRAKLDWAKRHIELLRSEIADEAGSDTKTIRLWKEVHANDGVVIFRLDSVIEVKDHWSLVCGDAVHNLRGALDYLAWQLAIRHFNGVAPTARKIIRDIYFPIISDENDWPTHPHRKYMSSADANKLERFQPFKQDPGDVARGVLHPLTGINLFSNADKHQTIQLTYFLPAVLNYDSALGFTDCHMPVGSQLIWAPAILAGSYAFKARDEIFRLPIVVTGPNPDVDFKGQISGYVATRDKWPVVATLNTFLEAVRAILDEF